MARSHLSAVHAAIGGGKALRTGSGVGSAHPLYPGTKGGSQQVGAPKPAGGAAPGTGTQGTALPWDAQAEIKDTNAQKRLEDYGAGAASNRDFRERYFGLGAGYNDPTANPASQAALLQHEHEVNENRVREFGGGNQLYAGSTVNRQQAETRRAELTLNALKGQWEAEQAKWLGEDQAAAHEREGAHDEAQSEAINRAAEAPLPAVPKPKNKNKTGSGKKNSRKK